MPRTYELSYEGGYVELSFAPLAKKEYEFIAANGLPDSDSQDGELLFEKVESNTWFTELLVPENDENLVIFSQEKIVIDLEFQKIKDATGVFISPIDYLSHTKFGKYVLACIRFYRRSTWSLTIDKSFKINEISLAINRYDLFGALQLESLSLRYEEKEFEFSGSGGEDDLTYIILAQGREPIKVE